MSDEIVPKPVDVAPDPAWPDPGMANDQWAIKLLDYVAVDLRQGKESYAIIKRALDIATIYSERPIDRFCREHLLEGHQGELLDDRLGYMKAICNTCHAKVEFEVGNNPFAIWCMKDKFQEQINGA